MKGKLVMSEIESAYRFIPVSKEQITFSPEWRGEVSMDIPFSNGVSGELTYTLKTESPLFIGGNDGQFCHVGDSYFIPGTSMKGCIRSVLEIMSFGHLGESRVKDNRSGKFPFRDIQDAKGYMTKMSGVCCGWLTEDGKQILKHGEPLRISYEKLSTLMGVNELRLSNWEISQKYSYVSRNFSSPYLKLRFSNELELVDICEDKEKGKLGTVIFSGKMKNKKSDFVLLDNNEAPLDVSPTVLADFKSLYPNYSDIPVLENYGRAVFFTKKNGKVVSIGLSYLHKYYAHTTIREAIPKGMQKTLPDLADVMFGNISDGLKGRIQFGSAFMKAGGLLLPQGDSILTVLGAPKASYYPIYLQGMNTWDYDNIVISGIKRYPIKPYYKHRRMNLSEAERHSYSDRYGNIMGQFHECLYPNGHDLIPKDNGINMDTIKILYPIKDGSVFEGKIRFFNLKPEELGALLSALTFHNHHNECKHSLGQAKSFGYGAVSLSINQLTINNENISIIESTVATYLQKFEILMNAHVQGWAKTPQLRELLAMAKGVPDHLVDTFIPMPLNLFGTTKKKYWSNKAVFSSFGQIVRGNSSSYVTLPMNDIKTSLNSIEINQKGIAVVTYWDRNVKKAKLDDGCGPFIVECLNCQTKIKVGDKIEVEICSKGGNIVRLKYIKKKL